jgi:2'-5' RNA ligase
MRLFTALDLPYEMRRNLELLLHLLKPQARLAWSPVANLHLTTKFIGDFPTDRLESLKEALALVPRPGALRIALRGLGYFPDERRPRVFYAGIHAPAGLAGLARATDAACAALGIASETKPYSPHLTLARIREPQPLDQLQRTIATLASTDFGVFEATHFHLYRSELRPGGSVYTKLASFPLSA